MWRSGRVEAIAVAPGIPTLEAQERRDRAPWGTYRRLALRGALKVADGLRVQPPAELWRALTGAWGRPARVLCDRFRFAELVDAIGPGVEIVPRVSRWSESSEDIRALRKLVADGPLAVAPDSALLITASLGVAMVATDDSGNVRMQKRGANNASRDDVAAALVLAAGSWLRSPPVPRRRLRSAIVGT